MTLTARLMSPDDITRNADAVRRLLDKSVAYAHGECTVEDVIESGLRGAELFLGAFAEDGTLAALVVCYPLSYKRKRVMWLGHIAGAGAMAALKPLGMELARKLGCDSIEGLTRPAVARTARRYGFTDDAVRVQLTLQEESP
jgi:predicted GNAT superfamily acetyltransferase